MDIQIRMRRPSGPRVTVLAWLSFSIALWLSSAVTGSATASQVSSPKPAESLVIPAYAYDRGNPRSYRSGRRMPTRSQWWPGAGNIRFSSSMTSSFPLLPSTRCGSTTPQPKSGRRRSCWTQSRWASAAARRPESWNTSGPVGRNLQGANRQGPAHGQALSKCAVSPRGLPAIRSPVPFPQGWKLNRPGAKKLTDATAGLFAGPVRRAERDGPAIGDRRLDGKLRTAVPSRPRIPQAVGRGQRTLQSPQPATRNAQDVKSVGPLTPNPLREGEGVL